MGSCLSLAASSCGFRGWASVGLQAPAALQNIDPAAGETVVAGVVP